ncbi:DUF1350 family protein [[Phormidium] sp. ETS-05]|uniref:DUF1350 family protein n=1 Tax=[Phormidium] sp. ETS-05 TaxID=222819 RepID=UPI0018EEE905|nr:DUF1350 family protein [[Phormidium] sp. ETS-05]
MDWQEISGNWVCIPPRPRGILHFLGGAFLAAAPQVTYRSLLDDLHDRGYAIVATPFLNTFDHTEIARDVLDRFEWCVEQLQISRRLPRNLPIYGLGHSMGSKIHLLAGSLFKLERSGNILIAYNNFPARRSIPFAENLPADFQFEFSPTPAETNKIIARTYSVPRNLLVKFKTDNLDQTASLHSLLKQRFPDMVSLKILPGNHLTPLSQNVKWQAGKEFTPLDAVAQWVRQEINREPDLLKQEIVRWLNPLNLKP